MGLGVGVGLGRGCGWLLLGNVLELRRPLRLQDNPSGKTFIAVGIDLQDTIYAVRGGTLSTRGSSLSYPRTFSSRTQTFFSRTRISSMADPRDSPQLTHISDEVSDRFLSLWGFLRWELRRGRHLRSKQHVHAVRSECGRVSHITGRKLHRGWLLRLRQRRRWHASHIAGRQLRRGWLLLLRRRDPILILQFCGRLFC